MIELALRCHHCARHLVADSAIYGGDYVVHCPDCLDPTEDAAPPAHLQGHGATIEDALENWFERREELGLEPELTLNTLANYIVPKSPEGWGITLSDGLSFYGPLLTQKAANDV